MSCHLTVHGCDLFARVRYRATQRKGELRDRSSFRAPGAIYMIQSLLKMVYATLKLHPAPFQRLCYIHGSHIAQIHVVQEYSIALSFSLSEGTLG